MSQEKTAPLTGVKLTPAREIKQPGKYHYVYSRHLDPIATVKPGERVAIFTQDAFESGIKTIDDLPSKVLGKYLNPQTGPIVIEGAEPGDQLAVKIESIEFTRDWGVSCFVPFFGGLTSTDATRSLQPALPEKVYIYRYKDGRFHYGDKFSVQANPFMGTMGTAPDLEALSALTPFNHGGNMDCPENRPGNTLFLPVRVPGAYFFTGDCHGVQGNGELCGVAMEITCKVTVQFDLIKNKPINWPRLESDNEIMVIASAKPMEDAARIAYTELVEWMVADFGWDKWDAYELLTMVGGLSVGNMVDTYYSLVAKCPKEYLKPKQ